VQDVDRPTKVETFAQPRGARRARVHAQGNRLVPRTERTDGIVGNPRRKRHLRYRPSIRSPESEFAVGLSFDAISLLVDGAVMAPTQ